MKRPTNRKRHRPEEVVAKLRQADEALAKGTPIAEVARSLGVSGVTLQRWQATRPIRPRKSLKRGGSVQLTPVIGARPITYAL